MNFSSVVPHPNISISRPEKVSSRGNMYKIPISHRADNGKLLGNYELWTTKEAVQQHFVGLTEAPREYQLRKFARQMYEKQLRSGGGIQVQHHGILVTTDGVTHGNPKLWPYNLSHPEVKI